MLIEEDPMGKYTVTVWYDGKKYEVRAYKEGELIKTLDLPAAFNEEERLGLIAAGKLEMINWVNRQKRREADAR